MHLCYVDEAGCPGALPSATSNVQPVLVMAGLILPSSNLSRLTNNFLVQKVRFNPKMRPKTGHYLDSAKEEIKGADLRNDIRKSGRNRRRVVLRFIDKTLDLLEESDARILARVYVKAPAQPFDGRAVYSASIQRLCSNFQHFLSTGESHGLVIADSRTPAQNSNVSHSIFTQKFSLDGDPYGRLIEMPMFSHSENHIALQITDILCSSILFPMATSTYCTGHVTSIHVHPADELIRTHFAERIKTLAYRYQEGGKWQGGLTVNDSIGHRPGTLMVRT